MKWCPKIYHYYHLVSCNYIKMWDNHSTHAIWSLIYNSWTLILDVVNFSNQVLLICVDCAVISLSHLKFSTFILSYLVIMLIIYATSLKVKANLLVHFHFSYFCINLLPCLEIPYCTVSSSSLKSKSTDTKKPNW